MSVVLNKEDRQSLHQELYDEVMGLGPLEPLLKDETVNDILVNGPRRIFVERGGKLKLTDITFKDERHLLRIIDKIVSAVGRRVDESNPYRRRPPRRWLALQRDGAAGGRGRLAGVHPEVQEGKAGHPRPGALRRLHRGNGRLPSGRRRDAG